MQLRTLLVLTLSAFVRVVNAQPQSDTYSCPKITTATGQSERAMGISLYSGHPSELAQLKPDNAEDDNGPAFWTMGPSEYDYWYVCIYKTARAGHELKLPKMYASCKNTGTDNAWDQLKCE